MLSRVQSSWQASSFSSILESELPLVLNSCPTKKKIHHHRLCDLLPSHYCEMYGFQNADFQLSFTSISSIQLFMMLPTPVHQTMYYAQTKRLSHTLVQLCGLYTTYTFLKNDVPCRWTAQLCKKKKSSNLANTWRQQVH